MDWSILHIIGDAIINTEETRNHIKIDSIWSDICDDIHCICHIQGS